MRAAPQTYEESVRAQGFVRVCGVDEVGRGAWAGPLVAAGVIFEKRVEIPGLTDSKKLSPQKRAQLSEIIMREAVSTAVVEISAQEIDTIGIGAANVLAVRRVCEQLQPDFALIDFVHLGDGLVIPHECIIRGDSKVFSIAAASVLAKVYRDTLMEAYGQQYPGYGFEVHKGYGTSLHQEALTRLSVCPIHRTSYQPVSQAKLW